MRKNISSLIQIVICLAACSSMIYHMYHMASARFVAVLLIKILWAPALVVCVVLVLTECTEYGDKVQMWLCSNGIEDLINRIFGDEEIVIIEKSVNKLTNPYKTKEEIACASEDRDLYED